MSVSPEVLDAIRTVAVRLGDLREQVVFAGGAVRGLVVKDPAVAARKPRQGRHILAQAKPRGAGVLVRPSGST